MLDRIKGMLRFQYNIRLVRDGFYGAFNPKTRQWNGMIRELIDKVVFKSKLRPQVVTKRTNECLL